MYISGRREWLCSICKYVRSAQFSIFSDFDLHSKTNFDLHIFRSAPISICTFFDLHQFPSALFQIYMHFTLYFLFFIQAPLDQSKLVLIEKCAYRNLCRSKNVQIEICLRMQIEKNADRKQCRSNKLQIERILSGKKFSLSNISAGIIISTLVGICK